MCTRVRCRVQEFAAAAQLCDVVLSSDAGCIKARLRRARARCHLRDFDGALEDRNAVAATAGVPLLVGAAALHGGVDAVLHPVTHAAAASRGGGGAAGGRGDSGSGSGDASVGGAAAAAAAGGGGGTAGEGAVACSGDDATVAALRLLDADMRAIFRRWRVEHKRERSMWQAGFSAASLYDDKPAAATPPPPPPTAQRRNKDSDAHSGSESDSARDSDSDGSGDGDSSSDSDVDDDDSDADSDAAAPVATTKPSSLSWLGALAASAAALARCECCRVKPTKMKSQ